MERCPAFGYNARTRDQLAPRLTQAARLQPDNSIVRIGNRRNCLDEQAFDRHPLVRLSTILFLLFCVTNTKNVYITSAEA
jgi:hypothetical protein